MMIAVTAASGQLGRATVKALIDMLGVESVLAVARNPEKAADLGVPVKKGDYDSQSDFEYALQGVDAVLLVSGMDAPDKRIGQHRNVIQGARAAAVKKIVYTSVQGAESGNAFSPIIQSNRQTELDVRASGLDWVIGRNGIYIEPDIAYIENYQAAGEIANCAGKGKCGYTTRGELAYAYARMLTGNAHNGRTYNLHGDAITQAELADYLNRAFGISLVYRDMDVNEYRQERVEELGNFIGTVIAGIYTGIRQGACNNPSDYAQAAGRPHQSWDAYFSKLKVAE